LDPLPSNVEFRQNDIVNNALPASDLCCSADFLEHLPLSSLGTTIRKIADSASLGYHKIACYDDGHSHLSILPPWEWLNLFVEQGYVNYRITKLEFRRNDPKQIVAVISTIITDQW
jgi:hypothetical protein